jgi:hypothetical protein
MKRLLILALLLFAAGSVYSFDFGLLAEQKIETQERYFSYNPGFTPWFSWNQGKGLSLYFSGSLSFKYQFYDDDDTGNDGWKTPVLLPELSRFAITYRPGRLLFFEAGRISYTDAMGFAASNLFDGIHAAINLPAGSLAVSALYTGLLYKETPRILVTSADVASYVNHGGGGGGRTPKFTLPPAGYWPAFAGICPCLNATPFPLRPFPRQT